MLAFQVKEAKAAQQRNQEADNDTSPYIQGKLGVFKIPNDITGISEGCQEHALPSFLGCNEKCIEHIIRLIFFIELLRRSNEKRDERAKAALRDYMKKNYKVSQAISFSVKSSSGEDFWN